MSTLTCIYAITTREAMTMAEESARIAYRSALKLGHTHRIASERYRDACRAKLRIICESPLFTVPAIT
jgi:hypothetical protein